MSKVAVTKDKLDYLANAIANKSGESLTLTIDEMIEAVDGIETGGGTPTLQSKTYTVTSAGTATVTADSGYDGLSEVEVSVASADPYIGNVSGYYTLSGQRKWRHLVDIAVDSSEGDVAGWLPDGYQQSRDFECNAVPTNTTITPSTSAQTVGGANYMMEGPVTVAAMPSGEFAGMKTLELEDASITIDNNGLIQSVSETYGTTNPVYQSGYIDSNTSLNYYAISEGSLQLTKRTSSDLTASGATVTAPAGYYPSQATKTVASGTEGTPTATKGTVSNHAVTVTPSVTNAAGYISGGTKTGTAVSVSASELVSGTYTVDSSGTKDVTTYASASVPSGTAGTPSATKGTVSNHSVTVTPSVTNTTGWITGSTKTGTAVTVSASELVSGNLPITQNGTGIDVSTYSTVSVDVSSGPETEIVIPEQTITTSVQYTRITNYVREIEIGEQYIITINGDSLTTTAIDLYGSAAVQYTQDIVAEWVISNQMMYLSLYDTSLIGNTYTIKVEHITGGSSSGDYIRTVIAPQQTVTPNSNREANPTHTGTFTDGEYYIITLDGTEWLCTCETLWGDNLCVGDTNWFFGTPSDYIYPFGGIGYNGDITIWFANTSQHTIKIERLDFVTGGTTLTTKTITQNGTYDAEDDNADGYSSVTVNVPSGQPTLQTKSKTYNATASQQTESITADSGYDGLDTVNVTVSPVTHTNLTAANIKSGTTVTISNGTSNIYSVTGTYSGGGTSKNVQVLQSTSRTNSSSLTKVLGDLTVSKTGTYDVYWSGGRTNTSTSYTWGTRLYVDGTGYGTENTTWSNNCQSNHLSNVSLTANQKLSVYARGRTGSYYTFAPMLVIVEA